MGRNHNLTPHRLPYQMSFRELAMCYYPNVIPEVASRKLRRLIRDDPMMIGDLLKLGYRPHQHFLTASQRNSIEFYLGTPEEFLEYTDYT